MNRIVAIALLILTVSHTRLAWAHGVVGDYVFIEPIITQDPTPANELDILAPSWVRSSDANTYSIGFSMEKVLYLDENYVPRFSLGGGSSWSHVSPFADRSRQGFGDLTLFGKYAFYYSLEHEFMMTIGFQLQLPTGSTSIEAQNHTSLGPTFLWEKAWETFRIGPFSNIFDPSVFRAISAPCLPWADTPAIICLPMG